MFSYRHAFHAGNHADVLKHLTLVALLRYLGQKEAALTLIDTHAGAGVYRLDQEQARTSAESDSGFGRLVAAYKRAQATEQSRLEVPAALRDYLEVVQACNAPGQWRVYPGSPWIAHALLRPQDQLKLFEVHPSDSRLLERQVGELQRAHQIEVRRSDGFTGLRALLPPPSRRALVLMDPSYELKTDYAAAFDCLQDALKRFPGGCYALWYPVLGRPEAHSLARKLKTLGAAPGRSWVRAELNVGVSPSPGHSALVAQGKAHSSLSASAMHVFNPPYTLAQTWRETLPWLLRALREPKGASWTVEGNGG